MLLIGLAVVWDPFAPPPAALRLPRRPPIPAQDQNGVTFFFEELLKGNTGVDQQRSSKTIAPMYACESRVCSWWCGPPKNLVLREGGEQTGHGFVPLEAILTRAMTYPVLADDGRPASGLFQTIEAVNLGWTLDEKMDPRQKLAHLTEQLSFFVTYLKSTRFLEHHADALRVSRSNLAAACPLVRARENRENERTREYLASVKELIRVGSELEPLLGEEYTLSLSKLKKPQREDLGAPGLDDHELRFFSWRYSETRSVTTFNECARRFLMGFTPEPPACVQQRRGALWWLNNATGKILVEKELLRLWANGRSVIGELEALRAQDLELLRDD